MIKLLLTCEAVLVCGGHDMDSKFSEGSARAKNAIVCDAWELGPDVKLPRLGYHDFVPSVRLLVAPGRNNKQWSVRFGILKYLFSHEARVHLGAGESLYLLVP